MHNDICLYCRAPIKVPTYYGEPQAPGIVWACDGWRGTYDHAHKTCHRKGLKAGERFVWHSVVHKVSCGHRHKTFLAGHRCAMRRGMAALPLGACEIPRLILPPRH